MLEKINRISISLYVFILAIIGVFCGYADSNRYNEARDLISPSFAEEIARYKCSTFFGEKELFDVERYYDEQGQVAVYVHIFREPGCSLSKPHLLRLLELAGKKIHEAKKMIKKGRDGKDSKLRSHGYKLLWEALKKLNQKENFYSIYISASKTHMPVIEWRKGLPGSYLMQGEVIEELKKVSKEPSTPVRFYYFGPLELYAGYENSSGDETIFKTGNELQQVDRSTLKMRQFRLKHKKKQEDSSIALNSQDYNKEIERERNIQKSWSYFEDKVVSGEKRVLSTLQAVVPTHLENVPDFNQHDFDHIFSGHQGSCAVMAFADAIGYHDKDYWNLVNFSSFDGRAHTQEYGGFNVWEEYAGGIYLDEVRIQSVDDFLQNIAEAIDYDFQSGGIPSNGIERRIKTFTNSACFEKNLSFLFDKVTRANHQEYYNVIRDELDAGRPLVLRTTNWEWDSGYAADAPGQQRFYTFRGDHMVVVKGYAPQFWTAHPDPVQFPICVYTNGVGNVYGDVWWDFQDLRNTFLITITPGGKTVDEPGNNSPITTAMDTPGLLSPVDGDHVEYRNGFVFFDWTDVQGAIEYKIQIDDDPNFDNPIEYYSPYSFFYDYNYSVFYLSGTLYWRVAPRNNRYNWGDFSSVESFLLNKPLLHISGGTPGSTYNGIVNPTVHTYDMTLQANFGSLNYNVTVTQGDWVTVENPTGHLNDGETGVVKLHYDYTHLVSTPGYYYATIQINSPEALNASIERTVRLFVVGGNQGSVCVDTLEGPTSAGSFLPGYAMHAGELGEGTLKISYYGPGNMNGMDDVEYSLSLSSDDGFLQTSQPGGKLSDLELSNHYSTITSLASERKINLTFDARNLTPGLYSGVVTFSLVDKPYSSYQRTVTLHVLPQAPEAPPWFTMNKSSITKKFDLRTDVFSENISFQRYGNTAEVVDISVSSDVAWLEAAPSSEALGWHNRQITFSKSNYTLDNYWLFYGTYTITSPTAGNSPQEIPVIIEIDTLPTVSITSPQDNADVSGMGVEISATSSDNFGIASLDFYVNSQNVYSSQPVSAGTLTHTDTFLWDIFDLQPGRYRVDVRATDSAGKTATATIHVNIIELDIEEELIVQTPKKGSNWTLYVPQEISWTTAPEPNPAAPSTSAPTSIGQLSTANPEEKPNVNIYLYKDEIKIGKIFSNISDTGQVEWTPDILWNGTPIQYGDCYSIKVATVDGSISGRSEGTFTLRSTSDEDYFTISNPNGGEALPLGASREISWNASGITGELRLKLLLKGVEIGTIAEHVPVDAGNYSWIVGELADSFLLPDFRFQIVAQTMDGIFLDGSDREFTIYDPSLPDSFVLVSQGEIVTDSEESNHCSWADYNNDGFPDLCATNDDGGNSLYQNNGDGTFTKITTGAVVEDESYSIGSCWGDYDNDGFVDLFVTNYGANALYRNNQDGTFEKILSGEVVEEWAVSSSAAWSDYDNDGYLDLFVTNVDTYNSLFRNNGDGTFTKSTDAGVNEFGLSWYFTWVDFNVDGYPDLFVNRTSDSSFLYENNGDGTFSKRTSSSPITDASAYFFSWADYDNDGDPDVFITDGTENVLYNNNGDGTFARAENTAILKDFGHHSCWGDYNNDGYLDLLVSDIFFKKNLLYHNNGNGTFSRIIFGNVVDNPSSIDKFTRCVWVDYDNDGDVDLFASSRASNVLYANNGNSNSWLKVKCVGTTSNSSAIGAKVKVKALIDGIAITQSREINAQDHLVPTFGLKNSEVIEEVKVEWPSGKIQVLGPVAPRQQVILFEDSAGQLTLSSPNGNELLDVGKPWEITWDFGGTLETVRIEYSIDNGESFLEITESTENDGSYEWLVPNSISSECIVRVSGTGVGPVDISDSTFSIIPQRIITVSAPNGGEQVTAGDAYTVRWSSAGSIGDVNIEYSTGGTDGTFIPIAGPITNSGTHQWTIPDANSSQCVVRITGAAGAISDLSDGEFTILPAPSITVETPNGGEQWQQGTPKQITWSTTTITGNVTIRVLKESGTIPDVSWSAPADSGDVGITWDIPADLPVGDDYTVRIYQGEVEGVSDAPFSITASLANAVHPDFNGDGKVDILWRHYAAGGGENFVWYMNGISRTGTDYLPRHAVIDWHIEGTGDFNGDGKTDILWRYTADDANRGQNAVWFMDGVTRSGVATLPVMSSLDWEIVEVDDFNNDGKPDILWRCTTAGGTQGQNVVWYMDGITRTGAAYLPKQEDLDWRITATGDFNNDGKTDILWRYTADGASRGQNVVWYMDAITRTGIAMLPNLTDLDWKVEDVADFNGDGKPDILWRNTGTGPNSGQNVTWFMDGVTRTGVGTLPTSTGLDWKIEN